MYKHMADSIKETHEKIFLSQEDIDKYNSYEEDFITKSDSYSKEEMERTIKEVTNHQEKFQGISSNVKNSTLGKVNDIQILGNTIQHHEELIVQLDLTSGTIGDDGSEQVSDISLRSNFFEVKTNDILRFFNTNDDNMSFINVNVFYYDKDKTFLRQVNRRGITEYTVAFNEKYCRICISNSLIPQISVKVDRMYLDNIKSVGNQLSENTYGLELVSCGKNIFDFKTYASKIDNIEGVSVSDRGFIFNADDSSNVGSNIYNHVLFTNTENNSNKRFAVKYKAISSGELKMRILIRYQDGTYFMGAYNGESEIISDINKRVDRIEWCWNTQSSGGFTQIDDIMIYEYSEHDVNIYETYVEHSYPVQLPIQLEKVGNVSDRVFRREDGVWCLEKNIKSTTLNGLIDNSWHIPLISKDYNNNAGFVFAYCRFDDVRNIENMDMITVISDQFIGAPPSNDSLSQMRDYEFISSYYGNKSSLGNWLYIKIKIDRLKDIGTLTGDTVTDNEVFKNYIKQNNIKIKYITKTPEILELPLDVQIHLNSFEGETNIFSRNTDVLPILKGSVPVTISSSIETVIDMMENIYDRIDNVKYLHDGAKIYMESNTGCIFAEQTQKGVIDDIKIEGETLVNILDKRVYTISSSGENTGKFAAVNGNNHCYVTISEALPGWIFINAGSVPSMLKNDTEYTIYCSYHEGVRYITFSNTPYTIIGSDITNITNNVGLIKTSSNFTDLIADNDLVVYVGIDTNIGNVKISDIMIIEGDHRDKPLSYFEGLKSVGDGVDNIEIISRKEDCNIIDITSGFKSYLETEISYLDNSINVISDPTIQWSHVYKDIPVCKNTEYILNIDKITTTNGLSRCFISGTDSQFNTILDIAHVDKISKSFNSGNNNYIRIYLYATGDEVSIANTIYEGISIQKANVDRELLYVSDTSPVIVQTDDGVVKPVLRSLIVNDGYVRDTIEKHSDGKWYYHERCGEVVYNGSENWNTTSLEVSVNTTVFHTVYDFNNISSALNSEIRRTVSNMFPAKYVWTLDEEGYWFDPNGMLYIRVKNSKLPSNDVEGFKQFLSNNNFHAVYLRKIERIQECTPLYLNSYSDETATILNSGYIPGKISQSISGYIGNVIHILKDRVSKLEDTLNYQNEFQNRLLLYSMYNADSTSLRVDIRTMAEYTENNVDDELYDLIIKNILAGKDNYSRIYIEDIIDFYTMIGKLSFEYADSLFYLISEQNKLN